MQVESNVLLEHWRMGIAWRYMNASRALADYDTFARFRMDMPLLQWTPDSLQPDACAPPAHSEASCT